jgi:hypothetical protein
VIGPTVEESPPSTGVQREHRVPSGVWLELKVA